MSARLFSRRLVWLRSFALGGMALLAGLGGCDKPAQDYAETKRGMKLEMVWIPGGTFMMGASVSEGRSLSEVPQHKVTLDGYWMGKYEVTRDEWEAVMGPVSDTGPRQSGRLPMENVNWYDAKEFCQKLSTMTGKAYRLPTEAEWEYACRAGTKTAYSFGDSDLKKEDYGWYENQMVGGPAHEVGQKKPNLWGLYDMCGNVGEWCEDWYGKYESGAEKNPTGPTTGRTRVVRGWDLVDCRSARRYESSPSAVLENGFRIVRGVSPR